MTDMGEQKITACGLLIGVLAFDDGGVMPSINDADAESERPWSRVIAAGLMSDLLPAVVERAAPQLLTIGSAAQPESRTAAEIRGHIEAHHYRRVQQRRQLLGLAAGLNATGIVPVLAGPARSLWLDRPQWRFQRAMPIVIAGAELPRARQVLERLGYVAGGQPSSWLRPDTHGWIELWDAGGQRRIEHHLPHEKLRASCTRSASDQAVADVLNTAADILHGMLCEHCKDPARRSGRVRLKALYEFATAIRDLDEREREVLAAMLAGSSELRAIFDAWLEAARQHLALSVDAALGPATRDVARRHGTGRGGHALASLDDYRVPMPQALAAGRAWLQRIRVWTDRRN